MCCPKLSVHARIATLDPHQRSSLEALGTADLEVPAGIRPYLVDSAATVAVEVNTVPDAVDGETVLSEVPRYAALHQVTTTCGEPPLNVGVDEQYGARTTPAAGAAVTAVGRWSR